MSCLKAISPQVTSNESTSIGPLPDQRAGAALAYATLVLGLLALLMQLGLVYDTAELVSALEGGVGLELVGGICLAGLLVTNLFLYRHYLLLLSFFKNLRTAFLRYLRNLLLPTPALCSAPRTAHGSRAPPFRRLILPV